MIFLKFPDEATFLAKAEEAGLTYNSPFEETSESFVPSDQDPSETSPEITKKLYVSTGSHEYSLDVVGIIYTPGEYTFDEETGETTEVTAPVPHEGYHINMVGRVPEIFQEYVIPRPNTPNRVFAGY